jgi:hypothetical protein
MALLTIRYTLKGADPVTVGTSLADLVAWERRYKSKASRLGTELAIEDLAFLAYEATKSNGGTVPIVFDDFVKQLADLEVVADEPVNPTDARLGAEVSPNS